MISKKLLLTIIISMVVLITGVAVPSVLIGTDSDSPSVTRLYADSLDGSWSSTSSATTRWVEDITVVNGQKTIVIQEVNFMQEAPAGTLVFIGQKGDKGNTGPQGPQGPEGPQGSSYFFDNLT